jgi:MFS family permease
MAPQYFPHSRGSKQEKKPKPFLPVLAIETRLEHSTPLHCPFVAPRPAVKVSTAHFYLIMTSMWIGNVTAYLNKKTVTTPQFSVDSLFQVNDPENMNWIATSYLLGFTATQPLLGKLSDIFGRSAIYNGTMLIFAAGSLWCSLAQVRSFSTN